MSAGGADLVAAKLLLPSSPRLLEPEGNALSPASLREDPCRLQRGYSSCFGWAAPGRRLEQRSWRGWQADQRGTRALPFYREAAASQAGEFPDLAVGISYGEVEL
jgi:hypothetical protein